MNYFMQCSFVKLNLTGSNNHFHVTYCSFAFMVGLLLFFMYLPKSSYLVVCTNSILKERDRWDECSSGVISLFSSDNRETRGVS